MISFSQSGDSSLLPYLSVGTILALVTSIGGIAMSWGVQRNKTDTIEKDLASIREDVAEIRQSVVDVSTALARIEGRYEGRHR